MAGVSTKEIKGRIRSMESTKQITKAMEMVAASKMRRTQAQVAASRPYFQILYGAIRDIARMNRDQTLPYLSCEKNCGGKVAFVVIAGDRGLCGGYNSNVLKAAYARMREAGECCALPVGRKAVDFLKARGIPLISEEYVEAEDVSVGDCFSISRMLAKAFRAGEYGEIQLFYTNFVSVLSQKPMDMKLLPLSGEDFSAAPDGEANASAPDITYEPDSASVFEAIIPEYLGGVIYGALCESRASEQAARRAAMDTATQNAEEMIANLNLKFNQARQAAITQEITEIVAGV